jgi:large subunit ribosomal protein L30
MSGKIRITLRKSPIGYERSQRETARALGFKKLQQSVVQDDNPVIRGMVHKIRHLVEVELVAET